MLTINQLIKIIIGIFVVVAVVFGVVLISRNFIDFFGGLQGNSSAGFFLSLIK